MYQRLGLAALVVSAIRSAVADPAVQEQVDEQARQIGEVRSSMDALTSRLDAITSTVAENGTLDASQAEELSGIRAELAELATALAGPADDPADNGVLAEVAPVAEETSPAADAIVESGGGETTTSTGGEAEQGSGQAEE